MSDPAPPAGPRRLRFPRAARLTRATEFRRVKEKGRSLPGRYLVLGFLADAEPPGGDSRVGLVTSRRVGNAVTRNRVRRFLREAVRRSRPGLRAGCWLVVVARHTAARATAADLAAEWQKLARKAGILRAPPVVCPPPSG